uniref:Cytochrome c oxidase subunit 7A1, mitochondrial n=1 Tax=Salarias fasciatus TaxID=181472 RepID=A0A672H7F1_SALFA
MNRLLKVPVVAVRAFSSSARQLRNKVPEAQKLFQEDNGLPVHIKGGTVDVLLYRATMTLTIGGMCHVSSGTELMEPDGSLVFSGPLSSAGVRTDPAVQGQLSVWLQNVEQGLNRV